MGRKAKLLILVFSLGSFAYGVYLELREDPTSAVARQAQIKLDVQLNAVNRLVAAQQKAEQDAQSAQDRRAQAVRERRAARLRAIRTYWRSLKPGDPVGRLVIPRLGLKVVFIQGADPNLDDLESQLLQYGPNHYPDTALPGLERTVAIAGHRTTYGAWFRHIDKLKTGDRIVMLMPYGTFRYRVERLKVVAFNAWDIIDEHGYDRLVLSSCEPPGTAEKRLVVFAKLV